MPDPRRRPPGPRSDWALIRRLIGEARPHRLQLVLLFANGLLLAPLTMLSPLPLKIAVDSALGSLPLPRLLSPPGAASSRELALMVAAGLLVAIAVLRQGQALAGTWLRSWLIEQQTLSLRGRLFLHAQRLSLSHHDRRGTADAMTRIERDVRDSQAIVVESLFPSLTAGFALVGMLAVTARIDVQLALAALAIGPMLFLLNQYYRRRLRVRWHEVRALETKALGVVQEVLGALRVVKAFGQEDREHRRFMDRSAHGMRARLGLNVAESAFGLQVGVLTALGSAIVLWVGVGHVQSGTITLGELLLVMGYIAQLYEPLKTISKRTAGLQSKLASAERVYALLDQAPDVADRPHPRPLARAHGAIEFHGVSFDYPDSRTALRGVSFTVPAASRVGIAGPTGAGKSTLVGLLLRLYDPAEGRILLDGVDLRDYRLADLRRQFAMVLQDSVLFSTSVGENIAYARPGARHDEIVAAARAAHAHEFIERLPEGYDTPVGERGMTLSGGERQRVALARAFLCDAPILILDEPTSAVDVRSETLILEALERLMRGRTTLIVAHRLSTLEHCDVRLEIDRGRVTTVPVPARA
ncbi:MAG TPA: ABC transporter ATP-binding protein [Candidatus Eisenbacteria bacterium]|nr:ABC transporter ATP-binding protein [Candidatus Eisenbacteria bacterium]